METKIICSRCSSESIKKDGVRKTENRGLIQRYRCKSCNHRFVQNDGFYRMRNAPQKITLCLDLFYRGVSTRKIQEHLGAFYPHNSDNSNIYRWIIKYSKQISQFTDNLKLKVGQELQIDEMEIGSKKSSHRGWFIDSIDTKTRFMVSSEFVSSRGQDEIKRVIKRAKNKTEEQIKICTTDGYTAYEDVVKKVFGYNNKIGKFEVMHHRVNASKGEGFNIMIERLHNNIRQRTKTFRGFHGSIESANSIMKGYSIYYNFITKHQTLNCCPYELATDLKLNSENKWLELINLSN